MSLSVGKQPPGVAAPEWGRNMRPKEDVLGVYVGTFPAHEQMSLARSAREGAWSMRGIDHQLGMSLLLERTPDQRSVGPLGCKPMEREQWNGETRSTAVARKRAALMSLLAHPGARRRPTGVLTLLEPRPRR